MKRLIMTCFLLAFAAPLFCQNKKGMSISYREYFDKVHGGWVGKAIGLALGVPKEYKEPWPPSRSDYFAQLPDHFSDRVSGDDVYVPLVGQLALKEYGIHLSQDQYLDEWEKRLFTGKIWVSCYCALDLHRAGIKAPMTGYPGYNPYWNDMCSQMSTDNIGWVAPGMINVAASMADHMSHIINWGVGADGGVFLAALDSEAFFTSDIEQLIRRARAVLPAHSRYGEMVDDMLRLHRQEPDWRMGRQWILKKYSTGTNLQDMTGLTQGAVVVLGLLYGNGDFAKSLLISEKSTWDSDTNPATIGGVLGTVMGLSRIDPKWSMILHDTYENYCIRGLPRWMTFSDITQDTVEIGEKVVSENGCRITGTGDGRIFTIPVDTPHPLARQEQVTDELVDRNRKAMEQYYREKLSSVTANWNPEWKLTMASFENRPEVLSDYMGRSKVLKVVPGPHGVVLERTLTLPADQFHFLRVGVAHHPTIVCEQTGEPEKGGWELEVQVDGKKIGDYRVATNDGLVMWEDPQFDLTPYKGKAVRITLIGHTASIEFHTTSNTTYWSDVEVQSSDHLDPWR